MSNGNGPVKKFRLRRVEAAIWAKPTEDGFTRYSISAQKSFRDKETGEWINSTSFFPEEAAILSVLIPQALAWIAEQQDNGSGAATEEKAEATAKGPF